MLIFLLEKKTQDCVLEVFEKLNLELGTELFNSTFQIILTDNGSEFTMPEALESDCEGNKRTKVFYCDPLASYQKAHLEKNHEFIRYVFPKGTSFDNIRADIFKHLMDNINSVYRGSLGNRTPYEVGRTVLDEQVYEVLDLIEIDPNEVILKEELYYGLDQVKMTLKKSLTMKDF
ncbi:hypothetical protein EZV73_14975 [Acidaminobacter sp. JC074]|uniref:hypothetical protein n=1 Tax=Acidaminobacter sp. JC074 TaxID=2530199 RepID=UPI001F0F50E7|nr:hypothetical protein [Acidaminobacter sp. JC074]MCH4888897.1 hypothetical protein [Acidaminobacter sp. JC074]